MYNRTEFIREQNEARHEERPACQPRCTCVNREELANCAQRKIFMFLGEYAYNLLEGLRCPPCRNVSLNCYLLKLACGKELPCDCPSLEELLCRALREQRHEEPEKECIMPWLCEERECESGWGCQDHRPCCDHLTPRQLEGIKLFLGCKVFCYLKRIDLPCGHPSLECSVLALACGGELPCNHPTLNQLLARALDCRGKRPCHPCRPCHK